MKHCLLFCIKGYWFFKAKNKPAKCIFKKSCSHFVYEETSKKGFLKGIKALKFRIENCVYGFELYKNPINNTTQMLLPNKMIVEEKDIAIRLLNERSYK